MKIWYSSQTEFDVFFLLWKTTMYYYFLSMSFYLRIFVYVLLEFRNGVSCRVFNAQNCQYFQEINIVNSLEIFTANIQMYEYM